PAEHEKQSPFLVIQLKRSPAVEMNDLAVVERDRIVGRYRPDAPRALRLSHVFSLEVVTITHAIRASNRTNVGGTSRRGGQIRRMDILFRHRSLDLLLIDLVAG